MILMILRILMILMQRPWKNRDLREARRGRLLLRRSKAWRLRVMSLNHFSNFAKSKRSDPLNFAQLKTQLEEANVRNAELQRQIHKKSSKFEN
jgi:hypothetical protein